jgi:hypothetical protein
MAELPRCAQGDGRQSRLDNMPNLQFRIVSRERTLKVNATHSFALRARIAPAHHRADANSFVRDICMDLAWKSRLTP